MCNLSTTLQANPSRDSSFACSIHCAHLVRFDPARRGENREGSRQQHGGWRPQSTEAERGLLAAATSARLCTRGATRRRARTLSSGSAAPTSVTRHQRPSPARVQPERGFGPLRRQASLSWAVTRFRALQMFQNVY